MSDVFISYARSTAGEARAVGEALRAEGYSVWWDEDLPSHRAYADVIEEQLETARAVVVIWSAEAVKSEWVRSEANRAREDRKLVQVAVDDARLPMPFDQVQCGDLKSWSGDRAAAAWKKLTASVAELVGGAPAASAPAAARETASGARQSRALTIAALPFVSQGDPDNEYFADGICDEIVDMLSRARAMQVIGSGSTRALKGRALTPQEAGRLLGADYILEGAVRRAQGRVRISVKVSNAGDGAQLWAERFEGAAGDVFDLQDRVALAVAGRIESNITLAEIQRAAATRTSDLGSFDLQLRASPLATSFEPTKMREALKLLEAAVERDPRNAAALAGGAWCHAMLLGHGDPDERRGHQVEGRAMVTRALEIARDNPTVLGQLAEATVFLLDDPAATRRLLDRAIELNPAAAFAWFTSGWWRISLGQLDAGVSDLNQALSLSPVAIFRPHALVWLALAKLSAGALEQALALLSESAQMVPDYPLTHPMLAACHGYLGNAAAARRELEIIAERNPDWIRATAGTLRDDALRRSFLEGVALAREIAGDG
jgi:adenylate cyclase